MTIKANNRNFKRREQADKKVDDVILVLENKGQNCHSKHFPTSTMTR